VPFPTRPKSLAVFALITALQKNAAAVELNWQAPPECPTRESVARDVARLSGPQAGQTLVANLVVTRIADTRWKVSIDLTGSAAGHRDLTADSCAQLSRAAALIIALAANPDAALDLPAEELPGNVGPAISTEGATSSPTSTPQSTPANGNGPSPKQAEIANPTDVSKIDAPTVQAPAQPATRAAAGASLSLFAGAGYDTRMLPSGVGLVRVGGTLHGKHLHATLSVDVSAPARAEFAGGQGAQFRSAGGQLLGCVEPIRLPVRTSICVGPRANALFANGFGTVSNLNQRVIYLSGVLAPEFSLPITRRFEASVVTEFLLFAKRPRFVIENVDTLLFRPDWYGLRAVATIALRF